METTLKRKRGRRGGVKHKKSINESIQDPIIKDIQNDNIHETVSPITDISSNSMIDSIPPIESIRVKKTRRSKRNKKPDEPIISTLSNENMESIAFTQESIHPINDSSILDVGLMESETRDYFVHVEKLLEDQEFETIQGSPQLI